MESGFHFVYALREKPQSSALVCRLVRTFTIGCWPLLQSGGTRLTKCEGLTAFGWSYLVEFSK
jgi:hypothetical protein